MNFKIYEDFTADLKEAWQKFYLGEGGAFNLSPEWCQIWFNHFGQDKVLFIITGWEEENIKLIAPFYKKGNKLYAIGSDFYDEFNILYKNQEDLRTLLNFIYEHNFELDLNFVSSDSDFFKYFIRNNEQQKIYNIKVCSFTTKPLVYKNDELKINTDRIYKRLKRKEKTAKRDFNDEIKYEFRPEKDKKYFDEFVDIHLKTWDTFKSIKTKDFIEDLYFNLDFTLLSRLSFKNSNQTLAYDFGYMGSDNVLYVNLRTYDNRYAAVAPGLFIIYYNLSRPDILAQIKHVDFGRGAMDYKYFFTDTEKIILNLKANLSWKRYKKIYYPLKKFKERIQKYGI